MSFDSFLEPQFDLFPASRSDVPSSLPSSLRDVESHYNKPHRWTNADYATRAHEVCHLVNADIRNEYRAKNDYPRVNGLYCLQDRAVILKEPSLTLKKVADSIPTEDRGRLYRMYLVDAQQWWNNQPLYILDEWVCYYIDARVSFERGKTPHHGFLEMLRYAEVLMELAELGSWELMQFVLWQKSRCETLRNLASYRMYGSVPDTKYGGIPESDPRPCSHYHSFGGLE